MVNLIRICAVLIILFALKDLYDKFVILETYRYGAYADFRGKSNHYFSIFTIFLSFSILNLSSTESAIGRNYKMIYLFSFMVFVTGLFISVIFSARFAFFSSFYNFL